MEESPRSRRRPPRQPHGSAANVTPDVPAPAGTRSEHTGPVVTQRLVERRTRNGGRIIVLPTGRGRARPGAPVAIQLWIMAGAAAERPDEHGCAHLLEHMLFKPSAADPVVPGARDIASAIESLGGDVNAFTSHDETVFHATVPVEATADALHALVGPVVAPALEPGEVLREAQVVVEEIKQYADDPGSRASDELLGILFGDHGYGRPVLGRRREVLSHDAARLRRFHRQVYTGDRAVLIVAGPVDPASIVRWARRLLDRLPPKGRTIRLVPPVPPEASRVRISRDDVHEAHVWLGWQAPALPSPDACALEIASVVLGYGEACRLSMETRRTQHAVTDAMASFYPSRVASTVLVTAHTSPGGTLDAVDAILAQIERLRKVPIDEEELRRAREMLESDVVYRRETVQGVAHAIGYNLSLTGDWKSEAQYFRHLAALGAEDVRRACHRWLAPERTAMCLVVPNRGRGTPSSARLRTAIKARLRAEAKRGGRRGVPRRRRRAEVECVDLPGGLRLRAVADRSLPVAAGWLVWPGGLRLETPRDLGASPLTATLLTRGCAAIDGDALAREIDGYAAVLEGFSGRNSLGMHFECLGQHLTAVLRRAIECATSPTFDAEEVDEEIRVALSDLDAEQDDLAALAFRGAYAALYRGHPFRLRRRGSEASLRRLTAGRFRTLWHRHYPIGRAVLGLAGDFDLDGIVGLLEAILPAGDPPEQTPVWPGSAPRYPARRIERVIVRPREQAHLVMAFPGLTLRDPDVYALDVLSAVLGGQAGRLFTALRERQGLVYNVSVSSAEGIDAGHVAIYAATSQEKLDRALEAITVELDRIRSGRASSAEVERAKAWIVGQHEVSMQRRSRVASRVAFDEAYGLGIRSREVYPSRIGRVRPIDLQRLAERIFVLERSVLSIVRS